MSKIDTEAHIAMAQALGHPIADKENVRILVEEWRKALEFAVNQPETGKAIGYIDAFMALVNFSRVVLEDVEARSGFQAVPEKRAFRVLFLNTLTRTLLLRLEKN